MQKRPIKAKNFEAIALGHFWTKCNEIWNLGLKYQCVCPINSTWWFLKFAPLYSCSCFLSRAACNFVAKGHNPFFRTFINQGMRTWKKMTDLDSWCCGESCSDVLDAVELLNWSQGGDKVIARSQQLVPDKRCTSWMRLANFTSMSLLLLPLFLRYPKAGTTFNVRRTKSWLAQERIEKKVKLTPR